LGEKVVDIPDTKSDKKLEKENAKKRKER